MASIFQRTFLNGSDSAMKKNKHISQSELESYLWGAATLLRGYIDGEFSETKGKPALKLIGHVEPLAT